MDVKGTAFLARKVMLIEEIGEDAYQRFLAEIAEREPIFGQNIIATTLIPIRSFIALNEAIVERFFNGDPNAYFRFGEKSAEHALLIGPYKRIRETSSIAAFVESARFIYQGYYTAGRAEGTIEGDDAELKIHGIPADCRHLYFEYAIAAYVRRGIELTGLRATTMTRVQGFSCGDEEIHYRYHVEAQPAHGVFAPRRSISGQWPAPIK